MIRTTIATLLVAASLAVAQGSASKPAAKTLAQDAIEKAYAESYRQEALGNYAEAVRSLAEVLEAYPKTYTVNYRLGWLYYSNRNYANATSCLEKALAAVPGSIEAQNVMTLVHVAKGDWVAAEAQALRVLKVDYYNQYANQWYSTSLRMQGKCDLSVTVARKMLAVFPTSVVFLQELGLSLFHAGEKTESRAVFESVQVLDPNNEIAKTYLKKY